jgi:hypothetical protein
MGKVGTKFTLLARKVPTLVATFPHKTSITTGSGYKTWISIVKSSLAYLFSIYEILVYLSRIRGKITTMHYCGATPKFQFHLRKENEESNVILCQGFVLYNIW